MVTFTYKGTPYQFQEPVMGNSDVLEFQRINRRTRSGDLIVFRDPDWPRTESFNLHFNFDRQEVMNAFMALLAASAGDYVTYLDHESKTWTGFFTNPDAQYTQSGINSFEIDVVFQVVEDA